MSASWAASIARGIVTPAPATPIRIVHTGAHDRPRAAVDPVAGADRAELPDPLPGVARAAPRAAIRGLPRALAVVGGGARDVLGLGGRVLRDPLRGSGPEEIGRASCRERV